MARVGDAEKSHFGLELLADGNEDADAGSRDRGFRVLHRQELPGPSNADGAMEAPLTVHVSGNSGQWLPVNLPTTG
jgi:hypothetical protein